MSQNTKEELAARVARLEAFIVDIKESTGGIIKSNIDYGFSYRDVYSEASKLLNEKPNQSLDAIRSELSKDYDEANLDKKRLAKEIDAMLGGTAESPSLCDVACSIQLMIDGRIKWPNQSKIESLAVEKYNEAFIGICTNLGFSNIGDAARVFASEYVKTLEAQKGNGK